MIVIQAREREKEGHTDIKKENQKGRERERERETNRQTDKSKAITTERSLVYAAMMATTKVESNPTALSVDADKDKGDFDFAEIKTSA